MMDLTIRKYYYGGRKTIIASDLSTGENFISMCLSDVNGVGILSYPVFKVVDINDIMESVCIGTIDMLTGSLNEIGTITAKYNSHKLSELDPDFDIHNEFVVIINETTFDQLEKSNNITFEEFERYIAISACIDFILK